MKKQQSNRKTSWMRRRIAIALTAGFFGCLPTGWALPSQGTNDNTAAAGISTSDSTMTVNGKSVNNLLKWDSFSIAQGETVAFDGTNKNYLNLVTGSTQSEIYGRMTGGNNVYLINPNGILFGATAQVNVGNLVASTRPLDGVDTTGFADGKNPLAGTAASAAGDIVNMGTLQAASVVLEGNDVRIVDTAKLTSDGTAALSNVTVKAGGEVHIGYSIGAAATAVNTDEYKNAGTANAASTLRYKVTALDGATAKTDYDYMLVHNVYELQNMRNNLSGRYMLAGDIDASETADWNDRGGIKQGFIPVGDEAVNQDASLAFKGSFDGAGCKISSLYIHNTDINYGTGCTGLFGFVDGGEIVNFTLDNSSVYTTKGGEVGGVVGKLQNGTLRHVYNKGDVTYYGISVSSVIGGIVGTADSAVISDVRHSGTVVGASHIGGIVGDMEGGSVSQAVNAGEVYRNKPVIADKNGNSEDIGGIVGNMAGTAALQGVENSAPVSGTLCTGGIAGNMAGGSIRGAKNTGTVAGTTLVGGLAGEMTNGSTINTSSNSGSVTGGGEWVGGVVGNMAGGTSLYAVFNSNRGAVTNNKNTQATGGLAGKNEGSIKNSYNAGAVTSKGSWTGGIAGKNNGDIGGTDAADSVYNTGNVWGYGVTGGVAGLNEGCIAGVYNESTVYARGERTGGLTGQNSGTIKNSYNKGTVDIYDVSYGGGIAGYNEGTIENVHNDSTISLNCERTTSEKQYYGGIVGYMEKGSLSNAYNTGNVENKSENKNAPIYALYVGGVIGYMKNLTLSRLYNTGAVSGYENVGGIVGYMGNASLSEVYNTGAVRGINGSTAKEDSVAIGGIVGTTDNVGASHISNAYNTGAIQGASDIGGIAGELNKNVYISNAYNTGTLAGKYPDLVGGIAGDSCGTIEKSYSTGDFSLVGRFDPDYGGRCDEKSAKKTLEELQQMSLADYGFDSTIWRTYTGRTTPLLRAFLQTVNVSGQTAVTYDGQVHSVDLGKLTYSTAVDTGKIIATAVQQRKAGTYSLADLLYSGQDGYDLVVAPSAALVINKKTITPSLLVTTGLDKTYDGTASAALGDNYQFASGDIIAGDTVTLTAVGTYANGKNASAAAETVNFTDLLPGGASGDNYQVADTVTTLTGTGTIKPASLTVALKEPVTKTYDGTTAAPALVRGTNCILTGVIGSDVVNVTAEGTYDSADVDKAARVTYTGIAIDNSNYQLKDVPEVDKVPTLTGVGKINARPVIVTPAKLTAALRDTVTKVYDGTDIAPALGTNYTLTGLAGHDSVTLSAAGGSYNSADVAAAATVTYRGLTLSSRNYTLGSQTTLTGAGRITPAPLTAALAGIVTKTYDGTTAAPVLGTNYTLSGLLGSDQAALTAAEGSYNSADAAAASTVTYRGLNLSNSNYTLGSQTSLTGAGRISPADAIKPGPTDPGNTNPGNTNPGTVLPGEIQPGTTDPAVLQAFYAAPGPQAAMASVEQLYSGTTARQAQGLGSVLTLPNFTIYLNGTGSLSVLGGGITLPSSVQMIGVDLSPQTFYEGRLEDNSRTGQKSTDRMEKDEDIVK